MTDHFNPDDLDRMSSAERKQFLARLRARYEELKRLQDERNELFDELIAEPQPIPTPELEPLYLLPTNKMRRALERFDALPDAAQVAELRELWGDA